MVALLYLEDKCMGIRCSLEITSSVISQVFRVRKPNPSRRIQIYDVGKLKCKTYHAKTIWVYGNVEKLKQNHGIQPIFVE